jgi:hypothetical protein
MTAVVSVVVIDIEAKATVGDQVNELVKFLRAHPEVHPRGLAELWFQVARYVLDPVAARLMVSLAVYEVMQSGPA